MSPENAHVFVAEDDKSWRGIIIRRKLEGAGHQVAFEAPDIESALEGATQAKELGVNVAVVDGNLNERAVSCADGRAIAKALRETLPSIKIIALSASDLADYGDVRLDKGNIDDVTRLPDLVKEL